MGIDYGIFGFLVSDQVDNLSQLIWASRKVKIGDLECDTTNLCKQPIVGFPERRMQKPRYQVTSDVVFRDLFFKNPHHPDLVNFLKKLQFPYNDKLLYTKKQIEEFWNDTTHNDLVNDLCYDHLGTLDKEQILKIGIKFILYEELEIDDQHNIYIKANKPVKLEDVPDYGSGIVITGGGIRDSDQLTKTELIRMIEYKDKLEKEGRVKPGTKFSCYCSNL